MKNVKNMKTIKEVLDFFNTNPRNEITLIRRGHIERLYVGNLADKNIRDAFEFKVNQVWVGDRGDVRIEYWEDE